MSGTVFLEGEKINLRTIEEDDVDFLRDGVNHPDVRVYMGNRRPKNLENEEDFFEEQVCERHYKYVDGEWKDVIWMSILESEYFKQ